VTEMSGTEFRRLIIQSLGCARVPGRLPRETSNNERSSEMYLEGCHICNYNGRYQILQLE